MAGLSEPAIKLGQWKRSVRLGRAGTCGLPPDSVCNPVAFYPERQSPVIESVELRDTRLMLAIGLIPSMVRCQAYLANNI
jgi:hypothetical protein